MVFSVFVIFLFFFARRIFRCRDFFFSDNHFWYCCFYRWCCIHAVFFSLLIIFCFVARRTLFFSFLLCAVALLGFCFCRWCCIHAVFLIIVIVFLLVLFFVWKKTELHLVLFCLLIFVSEICFWKSRVS